MDEVNGSPEEFCPYVGLQPYSEADQDYFFGRERDIRVISSNLFAAPLTVLYGPSGVGKSSLLQAGVFSRVKNSPRTAVLIFDGWADQNVLSSLKTGCVDVISEAIGAEPAFDPAQPLDDILYAALHQTGITLLVIFDQFEEYFLYHPESEKEYSFDSEFARSVNRQDVDVNFLVSMREDSLSRLDRFRTRIPNMLSNALRLRHLDAPAARDAMRKPLEVYARQNPTLPAVSIEEALVEELIEEIQVEKLMIGQGGQGIVERMDTDGEVRIEAPFLQLALTRLWHEERERGSQVLRQETLQALGGAGRIIRTHMDSAMSALSTEEQEIAADLFRYMVTPSGTKIAYTVADLEYYAGTDMPLQPILDKLSQGNVRILRPVTTPGEPGILRYQIYHDVLAPAVLDWRARYENYKQLLGLFNLLIEKGDMESAFKVYQDIVQRTPQLAFFPERYEVQKILGRSELGVVYLIMDPNENVPLVATILDHSFEFTKEYLNQFVGRMYQLSASARISQILGFSRHRGETYLLTEFVAGPNLRIRLDEEEPLAYREAMDIARQITEALEDAHAQGLPFLILRPDNVLLSADGVKLVNFGLAQLIGNKSKPASSMLKYKNDYLAPEQLDGDTGDERSDIYALGTILYEMLIGHPPSVGRFYYPSEVNLEATEAVDILIDHARETDPQKRFATASEMRTEIDRITNTSLRMKPNQILRIGLAWISERYKKLTTRRGLYFSLSVLAASMILSLITNLPAQVRLPALLTFPLLLNSLVNSILSDWGIRALARRRGLGSLSTSGRGMGALLGLVLTLHIIRSAGIDPIIQTQYIVEGFFFGALVYSIFLAAVVLVIVIAIAWVTERLFKSYTSGFYWGFAVLVILDIILIILGISTAFSVQI
jgi:serine/threonine protein kinase